jgi:predicted AAA+ superfamily ATPase
MSAVKLKEIYTNLLSLAVFPKLLEDSVVLALCEYLCADDDTDMRVSEYANFVSKVFSCGSSFAKHLQNLVNDDENVYIRTIGAGKTPSIALEKAVNAELDILQSVSEITPELLKANIDYSGYLPDFDVEKVNIPDEYRYRCNNVNRFGFGIYSKYKMFYLDDDRSIVPVKNPDSITLSELVDYKNEQNVIIENTLALLEGKPAANILLTGDAGTGKSSTIKAVANELYGKGLRILEVRKEQLYALPEILDQLSENPFKFIIFVDDLSFREDDDNFGALKAILEGSVSARSGNVVIYATSNRRHLVRKPFPVEKVMMFTATILCRKFFLFLPASEFIFPSTSRTRRPISISLPTLQRKRELLCPKTKCTFWQNASLLKRAAEAHERQNSL